MNILLFDKDQERQLEQYYRQLADLAPHPAIRDMLLTLAQAENHHIDLLERMHQGFSPHVRSRPPLTGCTHIISKAVIDMKQRGIDITELDHYERARDVELQKERFYLDRACESGVLVHKRLFKELAQDEHIHYQVMADLCRSLAAVYTHPAQDILQKSLMDFNVRPGIPGTDAPQNASGPPAPLCRQTA